MADNKSTAPVSGPMGNKQGAPSGKPKNFGKTWKRLFDKGSKYKTPVIVAVIFAILGAVATIIGPNFIGKMTNLIQVGLYGQIDLDAVVDIAIFLVVLYGVGFILSYFNGRIMASTTQLVAMDLREQMSKKINVLPLAYFDKTTVGDVLSRMTNDIDFIGQNLNRTMNVMITAVAMFVGSIVMMFITNYILAFVAIGAALVGFGLMSFIISKSQKYFMRQQVELGSMNGHIEEIFSGHNIVKVYNAGEGEGEKFRELNKNLKESAWKSQFFSGIMMPLMHFVGNFGYVAVCVVGGILAFSGKIQFGVVVSFMIYVRLFTNPLSQFAQVATALQSTAASAERVFELLDEKELEDESQKTEYLDPAVVKGDVEFENVRFGYDADKIIVKDFSAKIKAGQKVAIVGPTGAGKTTMVNLLMRFYELNSGEIKIDGVPISKLTRENIHDIFCMVLQDTWLFEGTIAENIIYSKEGAAHDDVKKAAKAVGLDHFVKTLPHGYDTVLSDNANLSAGQKQLMTIARAMVENAPMLILDEATSSVDTRTEAIIQAAMDKLVEGRTSFVIAHRLSTIKNANVILVMRDGDIIESGNHDELMAKGGFYAELYNSQFAK